MALASLVAHGDAAWNEATRQLVEKAARDAEALEDGNRWDPMSKSVETSSNLGVTILGILGTTFFWGELKKGRSKVVIAVSGWSEKRGSFTWTKRCARTIDP